MKAKPCFFVWYQESEVFFGGGKGGLVSLFLLGFASLFRSWGPKAMYKKSDVRIPFFFFFFLLSHHTFSILHCHLINYRAKAFNHTSLPFSFHISYRDNISIFLSFLLFIRSHSSSSHRGYRYLSSLRKENLFITYLSSILLTPRYSLLTRLCT